MVRASSGSRFWIIVGSDQAISIRDLACLVRDMLRSDNQTVSDVKVLGAPVPGAANYYVPVVDRAMKELGLGLNFGLSAAIRGSVEGCASPLG